MEPDRETEVFSLLKKCEPKPVPANRKQEIWSAVLVCGAIVFLFVAVLKGWI